MRHDGPHPYAIHVQVHIERGAWVTAPPAIVVLPYFQDRTARQDGVAKMPPMPHGLRTGDGVKAGLAGQCFQSVDFLKADGVAAQLSDHPRNPRVVAPAVATDAAVQVVRS